MSKLVKIPLALVGIVAGLFTVTFTIYMFNLDMKLMAVIAPFLEKCYDSREHDFYL